MPLYQLLPGFDLGDCDGMNDDEGDAVSVGVADRDDVGVLVTLDDRVTLGDDEGDGADDSLSDGVNDTVGVIDDVREMVGERLGVLDLGGLTDGVTEIDFVASLLPRDCKALLCLSISIAFDEMPLTDASIDVPSCSWLN